MEWMLLIVVGTSIWVFFDARSIGVKKTSEKSFINMNPVGWFGCSLLLWVVVFPMYLAKRGQLKRAFQKQ